MANAVLRLSDVITPEIYERYLIEKSIYKNIFVKSGIMVTDPRFNNLVAGGGETFNLPFWQDLSGSPSPIQSNSDIEVKKTTTAKQVARRFMFARGWSAEEIASAMSGEDAMGAIESMVDGYWNRFYNSFLFSCIKGTIADNIDNDSGDLVEDITTPGTPGSANKINSDSVIDALLKQGDKLDELAGIAVHSTVYGQMLKNDLIDTIPDSQEGKEIKKFMGLNVIVDDGLVADTDGANSEYWNILFRPNSIAYGESGNGITPVETARDAAASEDQLFTRRQYTIHPRGFKWVENSVASDNPTQSEVEEAGNWDRVFEKKNCGYVVLISNG